jgi:hypothetical protein
MKPHKIPVLTGAGVIALAALFGFSQSNLVRAKEGDASWRSAPNSHLVQLAQGFDKDKGRGGAPKAPPRGPGAGPGPGAAPKFAPKGPSGPGFAPKAAPKFAPKAPSPGPSFPKSSPKFLPKSPPAAGFGPGAPKGPVPGISRPPRHGEFRRPPGMNRPPVFQSPLARALRGRPLHVDRGPHRVRYRGYYRTLVGLSLLTPLFWNDAYYYPYAYVQIDEDMCVGETDDGCELDWIDVPTVDGFYVPQCVAFCPAP